MILTPILVIRPFAKDGWRMARNLSLGSMCGVLLVHLLAVVLPQAMPPQLPAIVLGVAAAVVAAKHKHPAVFVLLLTATIVLFHSTHADLLLMANRRLQANAIGIGVAMVVLALADLGERQLKRAST